MVNKVTLIGHVGRDPEVKYTSSGQAVANFSLATDETYKDRAGEKQKKTSWHRLTAWGKLAEIVQKYVKKGSLLFVEGTINYRSWEGQDGKKEATEINISEMKMLGEKQQAVGETRQTDPQEISDEDIPF